MKMQLLRMQAILANKLCGLVNLLQMPFTQDGFEPLYPLLKSKKLAGFLATYATMCRAWAVNTGIDASSGLGYVQWIIMAIGTILIPVLFAIVLYIFNKTLGISLNASSGL